MLKSKDEIKDKHYRFYSSEHRKQELRPRLIIIANAPAPALAKVAGTSQGDLGEDNESSVRAESSTRSETNAPTEFSMTQNYPNPFNPETQIRYELPTSGVVTLTIFDIRGKEIRKLLNRNETSAGVFAVVWDGLDSSGRKAASGRVPGWRQFP